jgi:hypothetical protein
VRTRKQFAFEHDALYTGLRQVARHARSSRAAANYSYFKIGFGVIHVHCFFSSMFASPFGFLILTRTPREPASQINAQCFLG